MSRRDRWLTTTGVAVGVGIGSVPTTDYDVIRIDDEVEVTWRVFYIPFHLVYRL